MALQFLLAPVVLRYAGKEALGAYSFLIQMIAWGALTDLGFGVATGRRLAQAHGFPARINFREVFETGRTFLIVSNLFFAGFILIVSWKLSVFIQLTPTIERQAKLSLNIFACWVACRGIISLYGDALIATQHMADVNLIQSAYGALRLLLSLCFVKIGWGLVGLIGANIIAEAATFVTQRIRYRKLFPSDIFRWGLKNKRLFSEMFKFGLTYMVMIIAGKMYSSTDGIVVGNLLGAGAVAIVYVTQMPGTIFYQLLWRISDNSSPAINEIYAQKNKVYLAESYLKLCRVSMMLAICLAIGLLFMNRQAISIWVGYDQYAGSIFTIALAGISITQVMIHVACVFLVAVGDIKLIVVWGVISGVLKVALSILLVKAIGIPGCVIGTLVLDVPSLFIYISKANRALSIPYKTIFRLVVAPALKANIFSCITILLLIIIFPLPSWRTLLIRGALYLLAFSVGAWLKGFTSDDRYRIVQLARRIKSGASRNLP